MKLQQKDLLSSPTPLHAVLEHPPFSRLGLTQSCFILSSQSCSPSSPSAPLPVLPQLDGAAADRHPAREGPLPFSSQRRVCHRAGLPDPAARQSQGGSAAIQEGFQLGRNQCSGPGRYTISCACLCTCVTGASSLHTHAPAHMHQHTCTSTHALTHMHQHTCTCTHALAHMHQHTCTRTHAPAHMH